MPNGKASKVRLIKTEDGSNTLYLPSLEETYHSSHGALQESEYVYIKRGLKYLAETTGKVKISILEVGFGTGLNALLTARFCAQHPDLSINYITLEPFPLDLKILLSLNYSDLLPDLEKTWRLICTSNWGEPIQILKNLEVTKLNSRIEEFKSSHSYDLVYYHAFAPNKQPEIWNLEIFQKLHSMMTPDGILSTYCAQSQFKNNLRTAGFQVESLEGAPGKFEMVRAKVLPANDL